MEEMGRRFGQIKVVILTKGENGSCCYDCKKGRFFCADAVPTKVASTVGAGDGFGAAFLTKYMQHAGHEACLAFASQVSAFVCSRKEAIPTGMAERVRLFE